MLKQSLQIFIKEAEKYYKQDYWRDDEEILVSKYFRRERGGLLVLGCGAGRTLIPLYKKGFDITAIDIVPEMVEFTKKKVRGLPIDVLLMDATDLKLEDKSFDYAFFPFHGLSYIYPDIEKCLKEVARVLKPNGVAIFNTHNRFYLKILPRFFKGKWIEKNKLLHYHSTPLDSFKFKKYFKKVKIKQRISLETAANWKDICYKLLPMFNKSTYWICQGPK